MDGLLDNVHEVDTILKGNCNAGVTTSNEKGWFGTFKMWINKKGIANLLSIPQLEDDGFRIIYDTLKEWVLITPEGKTIVFQRDTGLCNRMPYIDMREHKEAFALLQTVGKNFEGFTQRQVRQAKLARRAQAMVEHPTDDKFKQMVSSKSFTNCRVKVRDVTNARTIFGPYLPGLGGGD